MTEANIRGAFAKQADWAVRLGAPFTASVCTILAQVLDRSTATGRRVLDWSGDPAADALALRLLGGLNAMVRSVELPGLAEFYPPKPMVCDSDLAAALSAALADDRLLPWLDSAPQTNEAGRSAALMAGLLVVADATDLPLALFELGASAGLNLRLGSYAYRLGSLEIGDNDAPLMLAPSWDGPAPPDAAIRIAGRRGVDLNPIDLSDPAAGARLLAYVWPEQTDRVARLEAAIAAFVADPVALDRGDAAAWVETNVKPAAGVATVVFHSIAFQYFSADSKARIIARLALLGASATWAAPVAWLRYEFAGDRPELRLTLWPAGEDRLLADGHPHVASLRWFG